jgi:hypothetical protein
MAGARFVYVVGIIVLVVMMLGVGLYGVSDFLQPLPSICAEYDTPSMAPAECHKRNVIFYIVALTVLGSGVGFLWRKLGQ